MNTFITSHLRAIALIVCILVATGFAPSANAVSLNPASRHKLDWFSTSDGMSGVYNHSFTNLSPGDIAAALKQGCLDYAKAHATPVRNLTFTECNPDTSIRPGYVGADVTDFGVNGTIITTRIPDGAVIQSSTGHWWLGQGRCIESLQSYWVGIGSDGQCYCETGTDWSERLHACVKPVDRWFAKDICTPHMGHPILPLLGAKSLTESLGVNLLGRSLILQYDSRGKVPYVTDAPTLNGTPQFSVATMPSFGDLWQSNWHKSLVLQRSRWGQIVAVAALRGSGRWVAFNHPDAWTYVADADVRDRLEAVTNYEGRMTSLLRYTDAEGNVETYDAKEINSSASLSASLVSIDLAGGGRLSFTYSDSSTSATIAPAPGLLIQVQDSLGHSVQFNYEQPSPPLPPRINRMTGPDGQITTFSYDGNGMLSAINWPDGTSRAYPHERADLPWAVTGVVDESGARWTTYAYDAQGRAIDTQAAGGVDHYSVKYATAPAWNVVETWDSEKKVLWRDHYLQLPMDTQVTYPNGTTSSLQATYIQGMPHLSSQDQPAGSGCSASTQNQSFDANGNLAYRDDFNGARTCYVNNLTRNLEVTRVEGLAGTVTCDSVTSSGASLPMGGRKVSSQWHPNWRLKTKEASPGLLSTSVYNGQPDPFNGNAVANCAPASATMPDGKPIAVLCKRVEQATTDTNGSQGFSATVDATVPNKVWTYTYNQYGQVLTSKGPRTDLNDTATYEYYADTTAEHTLGDLKKVTNAKGQVTQYPLYNKAGQVLKMVDANLVTTDYTYDARQRLKTETVAGQTTNYDYLPSGQLKRVKQPDASYVEYSYDDAQRLVAVNDNLGNRIDYTLDNAGRRTDEKVKDPGGVLSRQVTRIMDALGRVQQVTGRE